MEKAGMKARCRFELAWIVQKCDEEGGASHAGGMMMKKSRFLLRLPQEFDDLYQSCKQKDALRYGLIETDGL